MIDFVVEYIPPESKCIDNAIYVSNKVTNAPTIKVTNASRKVTKTLIPKVKKTKVTKTPIPRVKKNKTIINLDSDNDDNNVEIVSNVLDTICDNDNDNDN